MTDETFAQTLDRLQTQLRRAMNGPAAESMRRAGIPFRLNYGASLLRLRELAQTLPKDPDISRRLLGQDVRELRLLGLMILPFDKMNADDVLTYAREPVTLEEAEQWALLVASVEPLTHTLLRRRSELRATPMGRFLPYLLLAGWAATADESGSDLIGKMIEEAYGALTESEPLPAATILRSLSKVAEKRPSSRPQLRALASRLTAECAPGSVARAAGEEWTELLDFLDEDHGRQD